jgi:BirA family transcriptional regulator, biotin operon repressor / biotin---[acetyl-CoA-carboxylase] ligase
MEPLAIRNPFPGAASFRFLETSSTMDEARRLVRLGFPLGTTLVADSQTAGRGRFPERKWLSQPGENLLATVVLAPEAARLPGLPLRMGLALCRAVDLFMIQAGLYPPAPPELKWPNDVLVEGKKLAGLLCEATAEATLVGLGVNVNQRRFPAELSHRATSLALCLSRSEKAEDLDRFRLLELVLDQVAVVLREGTWREEAEALLWRRGEWVRFQNGLPEKGDIVEGRLAGLDPTGALLIETEKGKAPQAFLAGELLLLKAARVDRSRSNHIR